MMFDVDDVLMHDDMMISDDIRTGWLCEIIYMWYEHVSMICYVIGL